MKGTLRCKLFGHKFIAPTGWGEEVENLLGYKQKTRIKEFVNNCWNCGLSKAELGITPLSYHG